MFKKDESVNQPDVIQGDGFTFINGKFIVVHCSRNGPDYNLSNHLT